jgi:lysophospholipase L1-like esterase
MTLSLTALRCVLIFVFLPGFATIARSADSAPFYLKNGDKVVFYGDSITEQRLYTTLVETYVVTRFPQLKISFIHSGWSGDRVGGGGGGPIDLRLNRDVLAYQPSVVTIMLGMNDGNYQPYSEATANIYQNGYRHILDTLQSKLPGVRLTLIQPSPYDDITRPPVFPNGYNAVLVKFGAFVNDLATTNKQTAADFNTPMNRMLTKAESVDPQLAQTIIPDRVHPSAAGHLVMAESLLKAWGVPSLVSNVQIDAGAQKVIRADSATIDDLKCSDASITWTETDACLPMPVNSRDPATALVLKSSDWMEAIDQELLSVKGLNAPYYEVAIDGSPVCAVSREELAKGVNLAAFETPMMTQAAAVHQLTIQHNNLHFNRWRTIQVGLESKNSDIIAKNLAPILGVLDAEENGVIEQQRAKAQPVPHHYELKPRLTAPPDGAVATSETPLPSNLGPNLALHKKYISSNPNPFGWDAGLTDGSWAPGVGTTFASDAQDSFPKSVTIDLEKPERLAYVLTGVPPFGSTKTILVLLSNDNKTFTQVGEYIFPQGSAVRHLYAFPPTQARYIQLKYPDHYESALQFPPTYVFTSEVEAYGPKPN